MLGVEPLGSTHRAGSHRRTEGTDRSQRESGQGTTQVPHGRSVPIEYILITDLFRKRNNTEISLFRLF